MKLSISNLTWELQEDPSVLQILKERNVNAIEVAPTKIWDNPTEATDEQILDYRSFWNKNDIEIVAYQSLLFGRSDLDIFSSEAKRLETLDYLKKIIVLGSKLGGKAFVFGSPKNRLVGETNPTKAIGIATEFFYQLGETANEHSVVFCVEPNPKEYGCDFITNTTEAIQLVKEVNHPGFGLHLDAGGMVINNEPIEEVVEKAAPFIQHFHISEPNLNMVKGNEVVHKQFARALHSIGYDKYVSIEMKPGLNDSNLISVKDSLEFVQDVYF